LWYATLERLDSAKLRDRDRMANPVKKLFHRDDPDIWLLLGPVEEVIHALDSSSWRSDSWIVGSQMNRVCVDAEWLSVPLVVSIESILHPVHNVSR
jgi:hypothetical protein